MKQPTQDGLSKDFKVRSNRLYERRNAYILSLITFQDSQVTPPSSIYQKEV
jgi:hypothetical protein